MAVDGSVVFLTRYTVSSGVHLCGVPEVIGSLKSVDCSGLYTLLIVGANEEKKVKSLIFIRENNAISHDMNLPSPKLPLFRLRKLRTL